MVDDSLHSEARRILDLGTAELRALRLSRTTQSVTPLLLKGLKQRSDYTAVMRSVTRLRTDLEAINGVLAGVEQRLQTAERTRAEVEPLGEAWWNARRRDIAAARTAVDPAATELWLSTWVDALSAARADLCAEVVDLPGRRPEERPLAAAMRAVTSALADDAAVRALPALNELPTRAGRPLPTADAVRLGVLRTRILLRHVDDAAAALNAAEAAVNTARTGQDGVWIALALAAASEAELAAGKSSPAHERIREAIGIRDAPMDVFVVAGLLAEAERNWRLADAQYDRALRAAETRPASPGLLPPDPSRFHLRRAHHLRHTDPDQALADLAAAQQHGVPGDDDPEGQIYQERAKILAGIADRSGDAAEAYAEAGRYYIWSGSGLRAVKQFERACELAPQAEYRWMLAEALRSQSTLNDGIVDLAGMREAARVMDEGMEREAPDAAHCWSLATQALIVGALPDDERDPNLMIERALLLKPNYVSGYGFLASLLRRQGFVHEGYETALMGHHLGPDDRVVTTELLDVLADLRQYDRALTIARERLLNWPEDQGLLVRTAILHLRKGETGAALEILGDARGRWAQVVRGQCYAAEQKHEQSRATFTRLWEEVRSGPDQGLIGWAAYRMGGAERLAEAIESFTDLYARAPAYTSFARDLGQMYLVRGAGTDLVEGERLLRAGVLSATSVDELVQLRTVEFGMVRADVEGLPQQAEAEDVLVGIESSIDDRCSELLAARRPPGTAVTAAAARVAHNDGRHREALAGYVELARSTEVREAEAGIARAVLDLMATGDGLVRRGRLAEAEAVWTELSPAARSLTTRPGLTADLRARQAIGVLMAGGQSLPERLAAIPDGTRGDKALVDAAGVVAHDVPSSWALLDRLQSAAADPAVPARHRKTLARLADRLQLAPGYRLLASDVPESAMSASVTAVEVWLGKEHEDLFAMALADGIPVLRERLAEEMGLRVPGVRVLNAPELDADRVELRIFEATVAGFVLAPGDESRAGFLVRSLEEVLRDQLFRLIGPDDVALWLEDWDPTDPSAPAWDPPDPLTSRLRLVRILRLLLREGVPVRDRAAVLDVFRSLDETGGQTAPLEILRAVRRQLGAAALGYPGPDRLRRLPEDLEDRVGGGLDGAPGTAWELDRDQAAGLVRDLRSWLTPRGDESFAVVVTDPGLRPFVWRLLASERPEIRVLAAEELP